MTDDLIDGDLRERLDWYLAKYRESQAGMSIPAASAFMDAIKRVRASATRDRELLIKTAAMVQNTICAGTEVSTETDWVIKQSVRVARALIAEVDRSPK